MAWDICHYAGVSLPLRFRILTRPARHREARGRRTNRPDERSAARRRRAGVRVERGAGAIGRRRRARGRRGVTTPDQGVRPPRRAFMVKFPNPTVEGDVNVNNAGVVGSKPLSSTRKSAEAAVVFRLKILQLVETERRRSRASVNQGGSYVSRSLALRRQRPQVRILSGAPFFHQSRTKLGTFGRIPTIRRCAPRGLECAIAAVPQRPPDRGLRLRRTALELVIAPAASQVFANYAGLPLSGSRCENN